MTAPRAPAVALHRRWWFGHALLLVLCLGIVGVAAILSPSPTVLQLGDLEIPVLCGFRRFFGIPCPGCGMTRSFVFMAHGQILEGFRANLLGPALFAGVASQVPWQTYRLLQGARRRR